MSEMDNALTALDDAYAEFLMDRRAELLICNGDDLIKAMESGVMWSDFIDSKGRK